MKAATVSLVLGLVATCADAHIALWHPSLYGFNYPYPGDTKDPKKMSWNNNYPVNPLREFDNYTLYEWYAHGQHNDTLPKDAYLEIKSGSTVSHELACNRAGTEQWRNPIMNKDNKTYPLYPHACGTDNGPLHNAHPINTPYNKLNRSLFGGTTLAIAYADDPLAVTPDMFTIISVNYTSPWLRWVSYDIPKGMKPCQSCLCTWNWIHTTKNKEGYGSEIYHNLYRCRVTGDTARYNWTPPGNVPKYCEGDSKKCAQGPFQPMYLWQKEGNNMKPEVGKEVPTYNMRYGFKDGAQVDAVQFDAAWQTKSGAAARLVPQIAVLLALAGGAMVLA